MTWVIMVIDSLVWLIAGLVLLVVCGLLGIVSLYFVARAVTPILNGFAAKSLNAKCKKLSEHLKDIDFFGDLMCGVGDHIFDGKYKFYLDDRFGVVVVEKNKPVGVIGFHIKGRALFVEQLQGFRGSNIGTDIGTFLLPYVERLAKELKLKQVLVLRAERNFYWEVAEDLDDAEEAINRRLRMERAYNYAPAKAGYQAAHENDAWSRKVLC